MATETTRTRAPKPVSEWTAKDSATFFLNAYVVFSNPDDALALGDTIQFGVGTRRQLRVRTPPPIRTDVPTSNEMRSISRLLMQAFFTALTERASPRCPVLSKAEGQVRAKPSRRAVLCSNDTDAVPCACACTQAIVLKVAELAAKKHGVANYRDLYKPVGNGEADAHIRYAHRHMHR